MATKKQAPQAAPNMDPVPPCDPRKMLIEYLMMVRDRAAEETARFAVAFAQSPRWALDNCDNAFEAAARLSATKDALKSLTSTDSKATVESMRDYALRQALNVAKYPKQSTSTTATLLSRYDGAAWAEVYEFARDIAAK